MKKSLMIAGVFFFGLLTVCLPFTAGATDEMDFRLRSTMDLYDLCSTNPDNSEHQGALTEPFIPNNGDEGYYGSGMASLWGGSEKLGPYADARPLHDWMPSQFHRSVDFCGTCHDVSNPGVGNIAHNFGA